MLLLPPLLLHELGATVSGLLLVGIGALPMAVHAGSVTCPMLVGTGLSPTPIHACSIPATRASCLVDMCSGATHLAKQSRRGYRTCCSLLGTRWRLCRSGSFSSPRAVHLKCPRKAPRMGWWSLSTPTRFMRSMTSVYSRPFLPLLLV